MEVDQGEEIKAPENNVLFEPAIYAPQTEEAFEDAMESDVRS